MGVRHWTRPSGSTPTCQLAVFAAVIVGAGAHQVLLGGRSVVGPGVDMIQLAVEGAASADRLAAFLIPGAHERRYRGGGPVGALG